MTVRKDNPPPTICKNRLGPAHPLWQLAPTRDNDGSCMSDFMMLIPGLADAPDGARQHVADAVRRTCEDFGDRVAFAEINYRLSTLWVSVVAQPGLTGRVADAIRQRLPEALLVAGQLGPPAGVPQARRSWRVWFGRLRGLPRTAFKRLGTGG